jgi:hypothetical protein
MPEVSDDAWIDLMCLIQSSTIKDGLWNIYYCYARGEDDYDETLRYKLRVALRAVGHKITKYKYVYDSSDQIRVFDVWTTVTEEELKHATKLYKDWDEDVDEEEAYYSSSDEEEGDDDSDDEPEEDNPN